MLKNLTNSLACSAVMIATVVTFSTAVLADLDTSDSGWIAGRADGHAPIGVMGDHTHTAGESMLSYRFMRMSMEGNRSGTQRVSTEQVLADFMVAPKSMDMEMHMLGAMFAPRDWLTLAMMIPYIDLSMDHVTRMGGQFTTRGSGLGDISLTGLFRLLDMADHRIHIHAGFSLPSGDINVRDDTPMMENARLPYPMQMGSGTFDLLPGVTYTGQSKAFSWGAQILGTSRISDNDNGYTLGDRVSSSIWGATLIRDWISTSLRLAYQSWGNIDGRDPVLNPMMVPTADPSNTGGDRMDVGFGVNLYVPEGALSSFRLAAELLVPVYQDLNGPQLETDLTWILGAQMSF